MIPDPTPSSSFYETALLYLAMVGAWIAGEGGKAALAGAAGGFVRWMITAHRRIREGVVSVASGALMAHYGTPLMLALLEKWIGELKGDAAFTAAFCSGLVGMSLGKLVIAYLEAHHSKIGGASSND